MTPVALHSQSGRSSYLMFNLELVLDSSASFDQPCLSCSGACAMGVHSSKVEPSAPAVSAAKRRWLWAVRCLRRIRRLRRMWHVIGMYLQELDLKANDGPWKAPKKKKKGLAAK